MFRAIVLWKPCPARDSRSEYTQAWRICALQNQTLFRIYYCLAFATNIECFREVSMIIFLDILENWLSASRRWSVENIPDFTKSPRSTPESTSNQGQCLKSLEIFKETFHVFRRIESKNSWKWSKLKTAMYLPLSSFPAAYFAFFLDFSHSFSDSDHLFRDPWVPLTFFPAATLVVYHIAIKIRAKINVLTQHSVNAHTKPLSEKQSLSGSCGGSHQTKTIFRICAQRY